jgi:predicted RNase H-related nuclease YkuK (DUF458 family)
MDTDTVRDFISKEGPETKYYIGCDSDCFRRDGNFYGTFVSVLVIHKNGNNGCKLFGKVETERIYIPHKNQSLRLMTEVYKVTELYMELQDLLKGKSVEIHLDINPESTHKSHVILSQASGYVKGVCGITPKIKPHAFAASQAADRLIRVKTEYPALYA